MTCKQTFLKVCCPAQLLRRLKSYDSVQQCPQQPEITVMEEGKFGKWAIPCGQLVSAKVLEKEVVQLLRIQR